jgi:hypothetical protein
VYGAHGREVSQKTAAALRADGTDACYLEHGITGGASSGSPAAASSARGPTGGSPASGPK